MRSIAAMQIHTPIDASLRILLHTAYRASRRGRILLILNGVSTESIDEILDPLVATMPLDIPGLRYVSADNRAVVNDAVREADIVFSALELPAAQQMLDRISRPTRIAEVSACVFEPSRGSAPPLGV